jgi:hypothetical protein
MISIRGQIEIITASTIVEVEMPCNTDEGMDGWLLTWTTIWSCELYTTVEMNCTMDPTLIG